MWNVSRLDKYDFTLIPGSQLNDHSILICIQQMLSSNAYSLCDKQYLRIV